MTIIVCLLVGQLTLALHLEAAASTAATSAKVSTSGTFGTQGRVSAEPAKKKLS